MIKLAGIVTLYNPDKEVKKNILSYLDEVNKLYVIDNTPDHDNKDILPKSRKIKYIFNGKNIGVASALNIGAKMAINENYEWLLTMDQDSRFKKNSVNKMKSYIDEIDTSNVGLITPWHVINTGVKPSKDKIDYPFEVMTSGNIINLEAYKKIGGYKDNYFIDDIDIEYCMNLNLNNYKIIRLNYVKLKHDLGDIEVKHILNRNFVCSNHNYIRRYYMTRNTFFLCDKYSSYYPDYCKFLKRGLRGQLQNIILFEKNKIKKIVSMYRGYKDYKKGVMGEYHFQNKRKNRL